MESSVLYDLRSCLLDRRKPMEVIEREGKLTLKIKATPTILAFLPELEGRRTWLKAGGLSIEDTVFNRRLLTKKLNAEFPLPPEKDKPIPRFNYGLKRTLEPHQNEAIDYIGDKKFFGLFMEQGTGKTKVAVDRSNKLHADDEIDAVLVVTKLGVHRQWVETEVPKDTHSSIRSGWWNGKPLPDELLTVDPLAPVWWAINYDGLRTRRGMDQTLRFCNAHKGRLHIICDESHEIKNSSSKRYEACMDVKPFSSHRMLLAGTPIAKDLTDEYSQLKWLDENIIGCEYVTTFKAQFCILGGHTGYDVVGTKNLEEFRELVDPYTFRRTKEDIGMLPKRYNEWLFDLTKEQKRLMRQVKKELIAILDDGRKIELNGSNSPIFKLQQITNGFIFNEGKAELVVPVKENPRTEAMVEWIKANEGKAIVWAHFIPDKDIIREALNLGGFDFVEYHSGIDQEARQKAKEAFMSPSGPPILIAGWSASTGVDGLQNCCQCALYYSNTFNSIHRWQSEDRIDRMGSVGASTYTDLIAKGGLDKYIRKNHEKKKGISDMAIGNMTIADLLEALEELE